MQDSDWSQLEVDAQDHFLCSPLTVSRADKRQQRKLQARQRDIASAVSASRQVFLPGMTQEQFNKSILAILLPFLLPMLRDLLISGFMRLLLDWLFSRLTSLSGSSESGNISIPS